MIVVVLSNTAENGKRFWVSVKDKYSGFKNVKFVNREATNLDGLDPSKMVFILCPGYEESKVYKMGLFGWYMKVGAISVHY